MRERHVDPDITDLDAWVAEALGLPLDGMPTLAEWYGAVLDGTRALDGRSAREAAVTAVDITAQLIGNVVVECGDIEEAFDLRVEQTLVGGIAVTLTLASGAVASVTDETLPVPRMIAQLLAALP